MVTYIADVQYEHGISKEFDNTKVVFKELEGFNHKGNVVAILNNEAQNSKLAFCVLNILLNIIDKHKIQRLELMSYLSNWFDKVYFEEA